MVKNANGSWRWSIVIPLACTLLSMAGGTAYGMIAWMNHTEAVAAASTQAIKAHDARFERLEDAVDRLEDSIDKLPDRLADRLRPYMEKR